MNMKRLFFLLLAGMVSVCSYAIVYDYDFKVTGEDGNTYYCKKWDQDPERVVLVQGEESKNYTGVITIPFAVKLTGKTNVSYLVQQIGKDAFAEAKGITGVKFSSSLLARQVLDFIDERAFRYCENMEYIELNNVRNLRSIRDRAFERCTKLKHTGDADSGIKFGSKMVFIGTNAFCNSTSIEKLTFAETSAHADGLNIGDGAFTGCTSLKSVEIPDYVYTMSYEAFAYCDNLTSVKIGAGLSEIPYGAFRGCSKLEKVEIPDGVETIGGRAFMECTALKRVSIGAKVETIGDDAFKDCPITDLDLYSPAIVEKDYTATDKPIEKYFGKQVEECTVYDMNRIGNYLFYEYKELRYFYAKSVDPNNNVFGVWRDSAVVGEVGDYAFYNCSKLQPASMVVTGRIGTLAFYDSEPHLRHFDWRNCDLAEIGYGAAYSSRGAKAIYLSSRLQNIEGPFAYVDDALEFIVVEEDNDKYDSRNDCNAVIETATNKLIQGCMNTIIPNTVTSIGDRAFYGFPFCWELWDCLTSIVIPASITSIGEEAFAHSWTLKKVTALMENPCHITATTFTDLPDDCMLFVPPGTKDKYIAAGWTEDIFKGGIHSEYLYGDDVQAYLSGSVHVPIYLENDANVTAVQFDVQIDGEFSHVLEIKQANLSDRKSATHTLQYELYDLEKESDPAGGRVAIYSTSSENLRGNNGALCYLTLGIDIDNDGSPELMGETYPCKLTNITIVKRVGTELVEVKAPDYTFYINIDENVRAYDANGNGEINITDAVTVIDHILGNTSSSFVKGAADVNGDGEVNISDAVGIIGKVLSGVSARQMDLELMDANNLNPQ